MKCARDIQERYKFQPKCPNCKGGHNGNSLKCKYHPRYQKSTKIEEMIRSIRDSHKEGEKNTPTRPRNLNRNIDNNQETEYRELQDQVQAQHMNIENSGNNDQLQEQRSNANSQVSICEQNQSDKQNVISINSGKDSEKNSVIDETKIKEKEHKDIEVMLKPIATAITQLIEMQKQLLCIIQSLANNSDNIETNKLEQDEENIEELKMLLTSDEKEKYDCCK